MKSLDGSRANETAAAGPRVSCRRGLWAALWRGWRAEPGDRRGVVIILALAVLAIIALAALSYMTVVRSDRVSSVIVAERAGYGRQPDVVIDHIAGLLTADLFGQKIVTPDVPRTVPGTNNPPVPNWPRPFEDGNQWDYPHADPWFLQQQQNLGRVLSATENDPEDRIAQPSQAWLAMTEPLWDVTVNLSNLDRSKVWLQITNLRSGYRWDPNEGNSGGWVRGDGRFADLLQFFARSVVDGGVRRGNSRVDLLGRASTPVDDRGDFVGPVGGVHFPAVGAPSSYNLSNPFSNASRDSTAVFDIPMTEMTRLTGDADTGTGVLDNADERWWVDTMGDGRPDARWQVLEALGDVGGLLWVVATRVIDASGLLNYNTALEYSYAGHAAASFSAGTDNKITNSSLDRDRRSSTGRTPADVDLFGLFYEMAGGDANNGIPGIFDTGPSGDPIRVRNDLFTFAGDPDQTGSSGIDAFEDHMYNGLGLGRFFQSADRAADRLLAGQGNQPGDETEPSYFNPGGGGFGGANIWRTRAAGIPSIDGWAAVPNYTQVVHPNPNLGLPDHALATADVFSGGSSTDTDSNTPQLPTLTDSQRYAFYMLGVLPGDASPLAGLTPYPVSDLLDLRSFWGTNAEGVSQIERRIDGPQGADGFGDGLAYLPDGLESPLVYGPLRSREPSLTARLTMSNDQFESARPTNEQIYHDTRRLLTPHSGAAPFSVVPMLNPAHPGFESGQLRRKPVVSRPLASGNEVSELFNGMVWALAPQAARLSNSTNSNEVVPVSWRGDHALPYTDIPTQFAQPGNPAVFYGGGVPELDGLPGLGGGQPLPGPATRLWEGGLVTGVIGVPPPAVGASYALRSALALTVNTITAANAAGGIQAPGIVRFYPKGETLAPGVMLPPAPTKGQLQSPDVRMHSVSGRLPFGDLPAQTANAALLPSFYLGTEDSGITAVGLDRQPFLIGAYSLAVYENPVGELLNPLPNDTTSVRIDPQDERSHIGSIFAVEIGNPWDTPLSTNGYEIQVHAGKAGGQLDSPAIRINIADVVIPPGQRRVFAVLTSGQTIGSPERAADTMSLIRTRWLALVEPRVPVTVYSDILPEMLDGRLRVDFAQDGAEPADGILFNRLSAGEITQVPVLLVRRLGGEFIDPVDRRVETLVDRMLPNFTSAGVPPFPAAYPTDTPTLTLEFTRDNASFGAPPPGGPPQYLFVRVTREAEYRRPTLNAMDGSAGFVGGFPAYVIERPAQNTLLNTDFSTADAILVGESFSNFTSPSEDPNPPVAFLTDGNPNGNFSKDETVIRMGTQPDVSNLDDVLELRPGLFFAEPFELFVPTEGILSKADILRLTAFAHIHRPQNEQEWALSVSRGNAAFSSFLLNGQPFNDAAGVSAPGIVSNPQTPYWLTVSEQLGLNANLLLGAVGSEVSVNPYFHVLNPLRDHRQSPNNSASARVADALTVPPAVRVLDAVEVFESGTGLIPGRININTAPDQVLKAIPLMMPRRDLVAWLEAPFFQLNTAASNILSPIPGGGGQSGQRFMRAYDRTRIESLTSYRDRYSRSSSPLPSPVAINEFLGFQEPGVAPYRQPGGQRNSQPRGIMSIGELATMHRWQALGAGNRPDGSSDFLQPRATTLDAGRGFAQFAVNTNGVGRVPNFGPPFEMGTPVADPLTRAVFGAPVNPGTPDLARIAKPADDAGERLAILRAMANIVETRSDVFLATFVVRGYRPSVIDSIRVGDTGDEEAAAAMNSERFRPEYETRWLVLFDRSNVQLPTDRPRVLLKAELPPARR